MSAIRRAGMPCERQISLSIPIQAAAQNPIPEDKLNLKTSEGTFKHLEPQGKISKWTDNLQSYIRSTMSYCDCRTLEEFTSGKVKVITKSPATTNAINK